MCNIIPLPVLYQPSLGYFPLTTETRIQFDESNAWNAAFLRNLLSPATGIGLHSSPADLPVEGAIRLHLDATLARLGQEGYRLEVRPGGVDLAACTTAGVFYGFQTLRQLLPVEIEERSPAQANWHIPCLLIEDWPRFPWRGFMLDEGRYFHGRDTVLQLLDLMALHKLNVFHWHLTEDQGWRIAVKKYPRLVEIGSHRPGTYRSMFSSRHDGCPHGGYYTREELREIVAYAAARHITIMPEIEMPGHSLAALAAYPEFSCTGGPFSVATRFGIFADIYCAGKEATFSFLQDVLSEVLEIFPSPFIHIGGDEAPKKRWKACPDCQRRIRKEGLKNEEALQTWFTNRIAAWLESRGRRLVGWNQVLGKGLAQGAVVQYWLGDLQEVSAALKHERRQFVMSAYLDTYLDHGYNLMPLSRAYRYEPLPAGLDPEEQSCILGVEFPLWTEWVPSRARLDYQAFPRLTAMAETAWTPAGKKELADFHRRLEPFLRRLELLGVRPASLSEVEPGWLRKKLGVFTIPLPQRKTAPPAP